MTTVASPVEAVLRGNPYRGYVYAYPHKSAYRRFGESIPLRRVWAEEGRQNLSLYVHVPFCSMRCGFCNLFTTPDTKGGLVRLYLDALQRQADSMRSAIPDAQFARIAVGGGTPTFLDEAGLETVYTIADRIMGARAIPSGVEASPDTLTESKALLLRDRGVTRVSMGIQSFVESETAASGRPQTRAEVEAAQAILRKANFPTVNLDLIYGLPGQTLESWRYSIREALRFRPEEMFLYPLYVRPLTGLGSRRAWDDLRLCCYREGRDELLAAGYEQVSMRMFRLADSPDIAAPEYCCQEDGMVGLGCGARSYTRDLHYSLEYAVKPRGVKDIIADYLARDAADFSSAEYGFTLNEDEQRRRYLLQSILNVNGLDVSRYVERFGTDPAVDFPDLISFAEAGMLRYDLGHLRPTTAGLERSDALGPWFFSPAVSALMSEYEPK